MIYCRTCGDPLGRKQAKYCSHRCANQARAKACQETPPGYLTIRQIMERYGWTHCGVRGLIRSCRLRAEWDGARRLISVAEVERAEQRGVFTKRQAKEQRS